MPKGDVSITEFADAVKARILNQVDYLTKGVKVVDADEDTTVEALGRGMGTDKRAVRIFPASPALSTESFHGNTVEFTFTVSVTVLYRKMGPMSGRAKDDAGRDVSKVAKDVISALQGHRLVDTGTVELLNAGGVACSPARFESDGTSLQAMIFTAAGRSREPRS
jgi:hypothetical protein